MLIEIIEKKKNYFLIFYISEIGTSEKSLSKKLLTIFVGLSFNIIVRKDNYNRELLYV